MGVDDVPVAVVVAVHLEAGFLEVLVAGAEWLAVSGDGRTAACRAPRNSMRANSADESDAQTSPDGTVAAAPD